jgi:hypothetical protein
MKCLALLVLLLPAVAFAQRSDLVPAEQLVASASGRWYAIVQPDGEIELIRRGEANPPARSRQGEAVKTDRDLRLGATAAELKRSVGMLHGIRPDPGDAVIANFRLRDKLDRLVVLDSGRGLVARYADGPSDFSTVNPVREEDGSDVALAARDTKDAGEGRVPTTLLHLWTLRDATFFADAEDRLLLLAGGAGLEWTERDGARLVDRTYERRPDLLAFSVLDGTRSDAPFEALAEQARGRDTVSALTALLLTRELAPEALAPVAPLLVADRTLPLATRVHGASFLGSRGDRLGAGLLLRTARAVPGETGPLPGIPPTDIEVAVRRYAIASLPAAVGPPALPALLALAQREDVGAAAFAALAGPWPDDVILLDRLGNLAVDRTTPPPLRKLATEVLVARADPRTGELLTALAADADPAVAGAVLATLSGRASDDFVYGKTATALRTAKEAATASLAAWHLAARSKHAPSRAALLSVAADPGASPAGRVAAIRALARVPGADVVAALLSLVESPPPAPPKRGPPPPDLRPEAAASLLRGAEIAERQGVAEYGPWEEGVRKLIVAWGPARPLGAAILSRRPSPDSVPALLTALRARPRADTDRNGRLLAGALARCVPADRRPGTDPDALFRPSAWSSFAP